MTPVDVSLCAHAMTSASASLTGAGASPGGADTTIGSARNGARPVTVANFWVNSPYTRCSARWRTSPQAAASQNAVAPPLPSITSYPSGRAKSSRRPSRTCRTRFLTGAWRCEVPIRSCRAANRASASGRTFDGPQPKRPSAGLRWAGICTVVSVTVTTRALHSVTLGRRRDGSPARHHARAMVDDQISRCVHRRTAADGPARWTPGHQAGQTLAPTRRAIRPGRDSSDRRC